MSHVSSSTGGEHAAGKDGKGSTDNNKDSGDQPSVAEIEADIARTREQLAATVDELTDRLDVKSRVKGRVEQTRRNAVQRVHLARDRATDDAGRPTPPVIAGAVAAIALLALVVWWRQR